MIIKHLQYLNDTINHSLFFRKDSPLLLHVFLDIDRTNNKDDRTSTSVYIIFLGIIQSLGVTRNNAIARSSTDLEYQVVNCATIKLYSIQSLQYELFVIISDLLFIYYDNIRITYLYVNLVFYSYSYQSLPYS